MRIFVGVSYFDEEEKPEFGEEQQLLDESDRLLIEKGKDLCQKALEQEKRNFGRADSVQVKVNND